MTHPTSSIADHITQVQAAPGWDAVLGSFSRFAGIPGGSRVLDVGCGSGGLARHLARDGHTVTGIDTDPLMIDRAQELAADRPGSVTFEIGNVQQLRFGDASFDAALATNVIFLLPEPKTGLLEMARVVRPGGIVAMLNPSPRMTLAEAEALADTQTDGPGRVALIHWARAAAANPRFTPDEARGLLAAAGLVDVAWDEQVGPGLALLIKGRKA